MQLNQDLRGAAGRFCPADYRLDHHVFSKSAQTEEFDLVYVVGGLYGNTEALKQICDAFEAEIIENKCLIFNGDFHWFDISDAEFIEIEMRTSSYRRLRGNVETEIARLLKPGEQDIGCGCAYPEEVSNKEVDYSNAIIGELRATYQRVKSALATDTNLAVLPMAARMQVGGVGLAVTHGDIDSLAGWSLAHNRIETTLKSGLAQMLDQQELDIVASSHTCLPAMNRTHNKLVVNNGAAGLANFNADTAGLITRIAVGENTSSTLPVCYETNLHAKGRCVKVQALRVPFPDQVWQQKFLAQWPLGSAAHESYWKRIQLGTSYTIKQAMQYEF
jgi:predicted phosphodiesterase